MIGVVRELGVNAADAGVLNQLEQGIQRIRIHLNLRRTPMTSTQRGDKSMGEPHHRCSEKRVVIEDMQYDDSRRAGDIHETFRQRQAQG